jgi:hypothetical protein
MVGANAAPTILRALGPPWGRRAAPRHADPKVVTAEATKRNTIVEDRFDQLAREMKI